MQIQWKDRYNIDYKEIDSQHRKLLDIVNDLNALIISSSASSMEEIREILLRLVEYANIHFKYEELHMEKCGYYLKKEHIKEHRSFIKSIIEFNDSISNKGKEALEDMLKYLKNWYLNHIIQVDKMYEKFFKQYNKSAEVKAIIFDYGNVIESFDNNRFLKFLSEKSSKNVDELRSIIYFKSTFVNDFETGKISSEQFYKNICNLIGVELDKEEFIQGFLDIFIPIEPIIELIAKLKQNYMLGLISNTNDIHFQHIKQNKIYHLFDAVSLSFKVGVNKPDKKIFFDILKKLNLIEEECIFIDDQSLFVKAAKDYYFKAIQFKSPENLIKTLKSLNIKDIN